MHLTLQTLSVAWLLPFVVNVYFLITENVTAFVHVDNSVILLQVACIAYCHFKVYFEFKTNCRSTSLRKSQGKRFYRVKGPLRLPL